MHQRRIRAISGQRHSLISEEQINNDKVPFCAVSYSGRLGRRRRLREVTVALAYSPVVVRTTRLDRMTKLKFESRWPTTWTRYQQHFSGTGIKVCRARGNKQVAQGEAR